MGDGGCYGHDLAIVKLHIHTNTYIFEGTALLISHSLDSSFEGGKTMQARGHLEHFDRVPMFGEEHLLGASTSCYGLWLNGSIDLDASEPQHGIYEVASFHLVAHFMNVLSVSKSIEANQWSQRDLHVLQPWATRSEKGARSLAHCRWASSASTRAPPTVGSPPRHLLACLSTSSTEVVGQRGDHTCDLDVKPSANVWRPRLRERRSSSHGPHAVISS